MCITNKMGRLFAMAMCCALVLTVSLPVWARDKDSIPVIRSQDEIIVVENGVEEGRVVGDGVIVEEGQTLDGKTRRPERQGDAQRRAVEDDSPWRSSTGALLARDDRGTEQVQSESAQNPLWELYHQVQVLSEEVRRLRGDVEAAQNQVKRLDQRQVQNYVDLDERLGLMEKAKGVSNTVVNMNALTPETGASSAKIHPEKPAHHAGAGERINDQAATPSRSTTTSPAASAPLRSKMSEKQEYESVYTLLEKRDFEGAKKGFDAFIKTYPQGNLTGNALYWLAELSLRQKEPDENAALSYIEKFVSNYPKHARIPDALYKKATLVYRRQDVEGAKKIFQRILTEYPNTTASRLADHQLKRLSGAIQ
ncbi:MAG: tol-pal system protein YbgF [Gammaproteobacteria bacterium]